MLPDIVLCSMELKYILSIRVLDLLVTLEGWEIKGREKFDVIESKRSLTSLLNHNLVD